MMETIWVTRKRSIIIMMMIIIIIIIIILSGIGNIFDAQSFIDPFFHPFCFIDGHSIASTMSYICR